VLKTILIVLLLILAVGLLAIAIFASEGYFDSSIDSIAALFTQEPELPDDLIQFYENYPTNQQTSVPPLTLEEDLQQKEAIQNSIDASQPQITAKYNVFLSAVFNSLSKPEGYDPQVAEFISSTDFSRMEAFTRHLVLDYSPRNPGESQVFVDLQICNPGGAEYEENNLLRALEDTRQKFHEMGYQTYIESIPATTNPDSGQVTEDGSVEQGSEMYNLVVIKPPKAPTTFPSVIEIGASLDTGLKTPGASKNAAGVAGLLEMAATLNEYPNHHPWRFIVFVENSDEFAGSRYHVSQIGEQPFKSGLILDGIGWSETEPQPMNCIAANHGIPASVDLANAFNTIRERYEIDIGWRLCNTPTPFSSETSYWEAQLPAVLSVGGIPYKNPTVDKCSDNMANLNMQNAFLTIQENIGVLLLLDQEP